MMEMISILRWGWIPNPLALLKEVVIERHQGAESAFYGIGIIAETEEEIAFQPANVFYASFGGREEKGLHICCVTGLKIRLFAWSISS